MRVNQLQSTLAARMAAARSSLAAARAADDDYLVAVREGELDSLMRLAVANDVEIDLLVTAPEADSVTVLQLSELEQRETA
ncbi:MAG TPA: hypothetical protein VF661_12290 [Actinomycetales bacterium]|jgi:hypothetical protein